MQFEISVKRYFLRIAKLNTHKKNYIFTIAKLSSRKIQQIAELQNLSPAKILCHTISRFLHSLHAHDFTQLEEDE